MDTHPQMPAGVHLERRGPHSLLLHPHAPRWAVVNATGRQVARLCDGQHTPPQMAEALARPHGLDPAAILPDVHACLESLRRAGFLTGPSPPPSAPDRRPWRLHLYLTERCNQRCLYCGVTDGPPPLDHLSSPTLRRLVDQAVEAGADGVAFGGGEPLLRDDCLALLAYSAGRIKTLLSTNATRLDEWTAATLADLGVLVQVSLDGATAATHDAVRGPGAFAAAWQGIERLQRAGGGERLALNVTLMRPNLAEAVGIVALAAERGVPGVRFSPVQRLGRAVEHWAELAPSPEEYAEVYHALYRTLETDGVAVSRGLPGLELEPPEGEAWCRLGHLVLVDARGDLYPCALLTAPQFRLGNVASTALAEALASEALRALVGLCRRRIDEIEECRACAWRHFCQAGCPASVWLSCGAWHATDRLCDLRRELYRDLILARLQAHTARPELEGERK